MLGVPDLEVLRGQAQGIVAAFEGQGVAVQLFRSSSRPPANLLFARDLFLMTPEGAIVSRMASEVRAGEERFAALALAANGIPILATIRGTATFEGADALWLNRDTVLVGWGRRTNRDGLRQVAHVLAGLGARTVPLALPRGCQHLLGVVNFVARDLAVVREGRAPDVLYTLLADHAIRALTLPASPEVDEKGGASFVTLGPRHILMPAGCLQTRRQLEREGITCDEVNISEYLKAAGGLACLTGILWRDDAGPA
jgi:N-dimethylarginine dimethylaminohydrolase